MVNYRRIAVLLAAVAYTVAAPCDDKTYDMRQNGTENYRLSIDGVVIAIAPAESLLSAVSDVDLSDILALEDFEQDLKPSKPSESSELPDFPLDKPSENKPSEIKPEASKPEEKPSEAKPDDKPEDSKPEKPEAPVKAPEVQKEKNQKKSAMLRKQENSQRLKQRLANLFLPFLRKRRHQ